MTEKKERNAELIQAWKDGAKFADLGVRYGISEVRASKIVNDSMRYQRNRKKYGELAELPNRVLNALLRNGITSKAELVTLLYTGTFTAAKGIGEYAIEEIERLTGMVIMMADGRPYSYEKAKKQTLKGVERNVEHIQDKNQQGSV